MHSRVKVEPLPRRSPYTRWLTPTRHSHISVGRYKVNDGENMSRVKDIADMIRTYEVSGRQTSVVKEGMENLLRKTRAHMNRINEIETETNALEGLISIVDVGEAQTKVQATLERIGKSAFSNEQVLIDLWQLLLANESKGFLIRTEKRD